ncbi:MAG: hypothetical protein AAF480_16605, partial [Actinomycetota bacterium]
MTTDATTMLFEGLEVLEILPRDAADPVRRAAATAGRLALQMGADVWSDGAEGLGPDRAFALGKTAATADMIGDPVAWAAGTAHRVLLLAGGPGVALVGSGAGVNAVRVNAEPWHTEATLFAASGLA